MKKQRKRELDELLYLVIENAASQEQVDRLNKLLKSSPEMLQYAVDFYMMTAALRKSNVTALASLGTQSEVSELHHLLTTMANHEKSAPALALSSDYQEQTPGTFYQKVEVATPARRINRFLIGVAVASLAALLVMIAYVQVVPPKESVAVLLDSMNVQWQGTQEDLSRGFVFYNTDAPRAIKKGLIELEFDYGAKVVIEGPSEFVCRSDNQIVLNYGRLYARVPLEATGFTVETATSRIVDIGTEFGVQVNVDGTTELHVQKGLTKLLTGSDNGKQVSSVTGGQARKVDREGSVVEAIHFKKDSFVRQIHSETGLIRKDQKSVDLADIAGGGNGFGTGLSHVEINLLSGELTNLSKGDRISNNAYHRVNGNPFIDGVFVPNGKEKRQVISSLGDVFSECPATQSNYYMGIGIGVPMLDGKPIHMDGVDYGLKENPSLFMHANAGITYDLDAIRSQLSGVQISRFQSTIGICNTSWRDCNADFRVLVDGQLRYCKEHVREKGAADILDIELTSEDRFLTLITTDGGDPALHLDGDQQVYSIQSDWCLFAEPVLVLE